MLLWGIAFEVLFAGAVAALPGFRAVFGTGAPRLIALRQLATLSVIVRGVDGIRRGLIRRPMTAAKRPAGGEGT